jgi:hypothetical protein
MVLFQKFVRQFGPSTKMAPTTELSLTYDPMGNSHKNLLQGPRAVENRRTYRTVGQKLTGSDLNFFASDPMYGAIFQ